MADLLCQHEVRYIRDKPKRKKRIGTLAVFVRHTENHPFDLLVRTDPEEEKLIEPMTGSGALSDDYVFE